MLESTLLVFDIEEEKVVETFKDEMFGSKILKSKNPSFLLTKKEKTISVIKYLERVSQFTA